MNRNQYKAINRVYCEDCRTGLYDLEPESVDLVITDPPFGINFGKHKGNYSRNNDLVLSGYVEIPQAEYLDFTRAWIKGVKRVLKPSGSMYIFSGWNNLRDILNVLHEEGFTLINHLIWQYPFGVRTERKFVTSHYHLLYVCLNDKQRTFHPYSRFAKDEKTAGGGSAHYRDKEDVWKIPKEYWRGKERTPTKLPGEIIRKILAYSSSPGDVILDPFMGSGQVAMIAREQGRQFVGFEVVKGYHRLIKQRLFIRR